MTIDRTRYPERTQLQGMAADVEQWFLVQTERNETTISRGNRPRPNAERAMKTLEITIHVNARPFLRQLDKAQRALSRLRYPPKVRLRGVWAGAR